MKVFDIDGVRMGIAICYDIEFPLPVRAVLWPPASTLPNHMATHRADLGTATFSLSNFTCDVQEALSDRARGPEFTREKVTMTQRHQLIGGMHRWHFLNLKEIMDSRYVSMR